MPEPEQETPWLHLAPAALVFLCIRSVVRWLRDNIPILVAAGASIALVDAIGPAQIAALALLALSVGLTLCIAYYRRFRFRLQGQRLLLQKGLFERSELDLNAAQIQQVMIDRPLHLRIFGLARLSLDTAGGAGSEVELPGISENLARTLHDRLQSGHPAEPTDRNQALVALGPLDLTLHGLASNHAWLLFAAALPVLQRLQRPLEERWQDWPWTQALGEWLLNTWFALPALALVLLLGLITLSVTAVLLRYTGFRLTRSTRRAGVLRQSGGLLSQREQYLRLSRLRLVEWVQTPVGRLLDRCHLICRQVGSIEDGRDLSSQIFTVPGLTPAGAEPLLAQLDMPSVLEPDGWQQVHRHYRRILMLRMTALAALLTAAMAWQLGSPWPWLVLALLLPPLWLTAQLRWRAIRWRATDASEVLVRRGLVGRRITLFRMRHVQHLSLRQSFWLRRRGLVSLQIALATGSLTLPCLRAAEAWQLVRRIRQETRSTEQVPSAAFSDPPARFSDARPAD